MLYQQFFPNFIGEDQTKFKIEKFCHSNRKYVGICIGDKLILFKNSNTNGFFRLSNYDKQVSKQSLCTLFCLAIHTKLSTFFQALWGMTNEWQTWWCTHLCILVQTLETTIFVLGRLLPVTFLYPPNGF